MCPEHARIGIVDDDVDVRESIRRFLRMSGHEVVAEAGSLKEALLLASRLNYLDVEVLLLDGNLGESNEDWREVLEAVSHYAPGVKVVAFSSNPMDDPRVVKFEKFNQPSELGALISKL